MTVAAGALSPISHTSSMESNVLENEVKSHKKKIVLPEYKVAFIGTHHKLAFFNKLKQACLKYERHNQYTDVHYLNFKVHEEEIVLEIVELGTDHTGAREMAIRQADAIILCYSSVNIASYHQLANCVDDYKARKKDKKASPIYVISNNDEFADDEDCDGKSHTMSSASEGYESEGTPTTITTPTTSGLIKRLSMEKLREKSENMDKIESAQGEALAKAFSHDCSYMNLNVSTFDKSQHFVNELVEKMNIANPKKKASPKLSKKEKKVGTSEDGGSRRHSEDIKGSKKKINSTVCSIQ
uniref:Ras family protein n=1 Tax=Rhabditophanes sp. KR3021 TaxID=114890 RepID=A0AC35UGS3_9BILA